MGTEANAARAEFSQGSKRQYSGSTAPEQSGVVLSERDTGARVDMYSGLCDCYCKGQGCTCDCHDCAFWQSGP